MTKKKCTCGWGEGQVILSEPCPECGGKVDMVSRRNKKSEQMCKKCCVITYHKDGKCQKCANRIHRNKKIVALGLLSILTR